ncbi:hypothetical protein [Stygiobacter electus]|uniref:Uncharacterized protein n=1 Tax=Stygiobacter electus TaxID=3032292 RepID=A0AAE3TF02_9BACT|nr:hypothetical protein [Stygiobacter electus]MDF1612843.1 hypothetical protein [Stygiobacter electus]
MIKLQLFIFIIIFILFIGNTIVPLFIKANRDDYIENVNAELYDYKNHPVYPMNKILPLFHSISS